MIESFPSAYLMQNICLIDMPNRFDDCSHRFHSDCPMNIPMVSGRIFSMIRKIDESIRTNRLIGCISSKDDFTRLTDNRAKETIRSSVTTNNTHGRKSSFFSSRCSVSGFVGVRCSWIVFFIGFGHSWKWISSRRFIIYFSRGDRETYRLSELFRCNSRLLK